MEDDDGGANGTGPTSNNGRMISRSSEGERKAKNEQQQGQESELPSRQDDGNLFSLFGKQSNINNSSRLKDSQVDVYEVSNVVAAYMRGSLKTRRRHGMRFNGTNPPIVIRNTYIGNKYESATHNGVNLGVDVDFKNDTWEMPSMRITTLSPTKAMYAVKTVLQTLQMHCERITMPYLVQEMLSD